MKMQIEISDEDAALIERFLATTSEGTHGPLTIAKLIEMLMEDVALMLSRPGCWEAQGMWAHLSSHGYEEN